MNENTKKILKLADGKRSSVEIAREVGLSPRYVRRVMKQYDAPRLNEGGRNGEANHQFVCGRRIDQDGYVLVTAPPNHPYARKRTGRNTKLMFEHRLVMEKKLGRYLLPQEVVDHIDGLTLHNDPRNLRLFESNAEHIRHTLKHQRPIISEQGRENIRKRFDRPESYQPVDMHHQRRAAGDVRLRQILLAWFALDKGSPFLLGTHRHLEKIGIDPLSRSSLERGWDDLSRRWGADLPR